MEDENIADMYIPNGLMRANEQDSILSSNRRQPQSLLSGAYDSTCERWMLLSINLSGTAGYFVLSHVMIIFYETRRFFNYESG